MASEELRLYTIKDLKDWVEEGKPKEGLSEAVITPTRAYSFIHNPYVTDDIPVVSALFVDGELAAFTAAFPERLARPDCMTHWINSLYVSPKYEGKGYGLIVLGSLLECYEGDPIFDLDAMDTSVEILKYLGLEAKTFTRFLFREKSISQKSIKGRIAYFLDRLSQKRRHHRTKINSQFSILNSQFAYSLSYDNFIDADTYDFMVSHSDGDVFLRSRETLNWMLHFPFVHEAPLSRIQEFKNSSNLFSSTKISQHYYVVKVLKEERLVGVYMLCTTDTCLRLEYLYYNSDDEPLVKQSILTHISALKKQEFTTTHPKVAQWVREFGWYHICNQTHSSFCYPREYQSESLLNIQGGDGDMLFC